MMLRTIIIDDERRSIDLLKSYLQPYRHCIEIVGTAGNAREGFELLQQEDPDLVFLDISMPDESGLSLLNRMHTRNFQVIFITAHSNYALHAFDHSAVHYLLKPIDLRKLDMAIHRCLEKFPASQNSTAKPSRLTIPTSSGHELIDIAGIIRCEADGNYTTIHLEGGKKIVTSQNIRKYEDQLTSYSFIRVHKSHLINLNFVRAFSNGKGGHVTLKNGVQIEISHRKRKHLLDKINATSLTCRE